MFYVFTAKWKTIYNFMQGVPIKKSLVRFWRDCCLKSEISPRSMEISGSMIVACVACCWRRWGRRWGCWGRKMESKSGLVGGGGLSRWSDGSSLIPLSQGEGTQRGEQGFDMTLSDVCSRVSRKLSTTPSPWLRICRDTNRKHICAIAKTHMQNHDTQTLKIGHLCL